MTSLKFIGSKFTKIKAERNPEFQGKQSVKANVKINSIEKTKDDFLKLSYDFNLDYEKLGEITINGNLFLTADEKLTEELLKTEKEKNYNSPEYLALTNLIIQKASIKAFELEEELGLPIHIKLPSLSLKK